MRRINQNQKVSKNQVQNEKICQLRKWHFIMCFEILNMFYCWKIFSCKLKRSWKLSQTIKSFLLFRRKLSFLKDFLNNKMTHHSRYLGPVKSQKKFTSCFVIEENPNLFELFDYQHFNESSKKCNNTIWFWFLALEKRPFVA